MKTTLAGLFSKTPSPGRSAWWIILAAGLSMAIYLAASAWLLRIGFPLDDAWIHQTYARSLALRGEWAFLPGQPSAGSTSPLWSALLAPGYWIRLAPLAWTFLLGWVCLAGVGITTRAIVGSMPAPIHRFATAAGLFMVFEWHLVWAALSGMETLLFAWVILLVLGEMIGKEPRWLRLGALVGVSVWLRPEGITLLGPLLMTAVLQGPGWRLRLAGVLRIIAGTLLFAVPYLLFNHSLGGEWWPNTFFAKTAEYAIQRRQPVTARFMQQVMLLLVGPGAVLMPGFILALYRWLRGRCWAPLAAWIWVAGYLLLFALRLPVIYQHGRYSMPCMPVYFLLSICGLLGWVAPQATTAWRRITGRAWAGSWIAVTLIFMLFGARAYAWDVAVIESEMVETARWIAENTEPQALIAAHDIGALGYYGDRRLLDLAGLVSPEVIPFIRDEVRLARFMDQQGAEYLMTFPGWYPGLVRQAEELYSSEGSFSPALGGENMHVYRWR